MRTNVDFICENFHIGNNGEIVCDGIVQILFDNLPIDKKYIYDIIHKRFPDVSRKGVFGVSAKSTCGDEEFDYDKGARIAETRMQAKAYNKVSRIYKMIVKDLVKVGEEMIQYKNGCDVAEENAKTHLGELDESLKN